MKYCLSFFLLMISQSAFASFGVSGGIRQVEFNELVRDLGAISLFKNLQSPKNIGNGLQSVGLEYSTSSLDSSVSYLENGYSGDFPDYLESYKIRYHRGLSGHGDLSASFGKTENFYYFSVDHKDVFLKHKDSLYGALRPTVNIGTLPNEMWIFTPGVDLSFGYEVVCFTPYLGFGIAFPLGFAEVNRGLVTTKEIIQKMNLGLSFEFGSLFLVSEYEISEVSALSFSLRHLF